MRTKKSLAMFIIMVGFLASFWTTESFTEETNEQPLKAAIFLDKEKFLVNEPIWLTLILENISKDKTLEASADPLTGKVRIVVVSYEGDTLPGGCVIGIAVGTPPTLHPGEKDIYFIGLTDLMGSPCNYGIKHEDALHHGRLIPEGEYSIQATVRYRYQGKVTPVGSNKLEFKVEKPFGLEKKAYRLLKEKKAEKLWTLIKEYPNSVYRDAALDLVANFDYHPEEAMEFIDKHPNSGLVASVIFAITPKVGKSAERKKFFEEIIKKHPNTKAGMYAENQLDKWRRGKIWVDEPIPQE
jgi:hypothetical protein